MRRQLLFAVVICSAILVAGTFAFVGCEPATNTRSLTVTPPEVNLLVATNSHVTFTVTEGLRSLSLPLKWWTSNGHMGSIAFSAGKSATYARTSMHGVNSVIVQDQYGARGLASVQQ
ncbi:MAG: hypothetical protein HQ559_12980 [Lentisphaerae bacterium]|nr:hypothetical protein [Lentisphaerota bacterium]